jgi:O-antigen/teichoic acid export membrane protein
MRSLSDKAGLLILVNLFKYSTGLLVPVFLVRVLTSEEYGTYQQLLLIGNTVIAVMQIGIPFSIYYYYTTVTEPMRKPLVAQSALILFIMGLISAAALFGGAGVIASLVHNDKVADLMPVYCLYVLFFLAGQHFVHVLVSQDRYNTAVLVEGAESVIRILIIALPFFFGGGLTMLVVSIAAYAFARFLAYIWILHPSMFPVQLDSFRLRFIGEQLRYSFPLGFSSLVGTIGTMLDRALIAVNYTTAQFAIYAVGAFELPLDVIFQRSVANVLRATFPALVKEKRYPEVIRIWRSSVRKLGFVVIPTFIFLQFFALDFITLLFTSTYTESMHVFRVYLLLVPLQIFALSVIPHVFGKTRITLNITIVTVFSNLVLSLALLRWVGYLGPAIGTIVSTYIAAAIYLAVCARLLECKLGALVPTASLLSIAGVAVAAGGAGVAASSGFDGALARIIMGSSVFGVVFWVSAVLLNVVTVDDRRVIRKMVAKIPGMAHLAK